MRYQRDDDGGAKNRAYAWLSSALVACGIALRAWQYLGVSSLWLDEATLANNVVARPLSQLLSSPLGHNQAAPIGFLVVEKAAIGALGVSELVLRAWPFACSIAAILLLWRVASRLLSSAAVPLVLAPFALAPLLIFHAAEVKQYSSDVAIALALLFVALGVSDAAATGALRIRRAVIAVLVGALAVWLSQPAVLVVTGLGAALAMGAVAKGEKKQIGAVASVVGAWALSALAAIAVSLTHLTPATQQYMRTFWSDGFWPLSLASPTSIAWPLVHTALLIGSQLGIPTSIGLACALLALSGIVATWKNEWRASLLLVLPLVVALAASVTRLYPFAERLSLFLIPSLLLLAAIGVDSMATLVRARRGTEAVLAIANIFVLVVEMQSLRMAPPVYRREEIVPAIAHLRSEGRAADASYVYYGAGPAYDFYNAQRPLPARATMGGCHRGDADAYRAELDALRGRARVWILFAHELPRLHERKMMLAHLDSLGAMRDSMVVTGRDTNGNATYVRLYLYDLSGAPMLDTTPVRPRVPTESSLIGPRPLCAPASD